MAKNESAVLWDTFQKTRDLTKWYFSLLKEADPLKRWEVNGAQLNSILWLASHLAWAENFIAFKGTCGKGVDIAWLDHYKLGADGSLHNEAHTMRAALDAIKTVHEQTGAHVLTLTDEQLEAGNAYGMGFGGLSNNRILLQHLIRHEAMHTGHLSWLAKFNKVESV
jgi:uncharacterized damage-inducible protein DinB